MAITQQTRRVYGNLLVITYIEDFEHKIYIQVYADGASGMQRVESLSRTFPDTEVEAAGAWWNGAVKTGLRGAPLPQERAVRITRGQVFRKPLSVPQQRLVQWAREHGGVLDTAGANWTQLRSIVDKGHGTVIERAPTGRILAIRVR